MTTNEHAILYGEVKARLMLAEKEAEAWEKVARIHEANYERILKMNAALIVKLDEYRAALEIYEPDHPLVTEQIPDETQEDEVERKR
jgi:hypothetical protein